MTFSCKLSVPADLRFLPMAQSWAREVSELASAQALPNDLSLELAVEEGFSNAALHAYPDGFSGPVHLSATLDGQVLTVAIRDEGLPYEPASVPALPTSSGALGRLGLTLISHAVDEFCFVNHGRSGKELRLTCYLLDTVEAAPAKVVEKLALAPQQEYQVRRMLPEEALQVTRVFWLAYGYSYMNESFYRPEALLHLIGSGQLTSFVAVAENGEVVGHAGLLRPDEMPIAEAALMVVSPAHRGRGLMERLGALMVSTAQELKLHGLYSNAATSHPVSQKESTRSGGVPCALKVAACPPYHFKGMVEDGVLPQRESYVMFFFGLIPPRPAVASAPQRHREILKEIYGSLGRSVTFLEDGPAKGPFSFNVTFERTAAQGLIRVTTAAADGWTEILRSVTGLLEMGHAEVVNLDLPLSQAATGKLWELAESAGFFFAGIKPHAATDGDSVRLQRLAIPYDIERLHIYSKLARRVASYVAEERAARDAGVTAP